MRVSTEEQAQEGFSIRAQIQKLTDFANIKDWIIYKIYSDEGISAKDITGRPAVQEMINDIRSGILENILVFKIDRLTRSTADLIYFVDLFNTHNCSFNSLMESIDTQSASGRMFLKIIGIFAEFERENIIERTKIGVERKVKEGYSLCTAHASFGYDRPVGQKVQTINEEEAKIVREVFHMFAEDGITLTDIARRLNLREVKTKQGKTWDSTKIRRLLQNSTYIGNVRHFVNSNNEQLWNGLHEAIIDKNLFETAQTMLNENKKRSLTDTPSEEKWFAGFLVCGKCGYKLKTYNSSKKLKTRIMRTGGYACPNRAVNACTASGMSHKKVEKAFIEYITQIPDLDIMNEFEFAQQESLQLENIHVISKLKSKLHSLEMKKNEISKLYVHDKISFGEYKNINKNIETDKSSLKAEIERLFSATKKSVTAECNIILNLKENWELLTPTEKRVFLKKFMDKIVIVNEKPKNEYTGSIKILEVKWKEFLQQP